MRLILPLIALGLATATLIGCGSTQAVSSEEVVQGQQYLQAPETGQTIEIPSENPPVIPDAEIHRMRNPVTDPTPGTFVEPVPSQFRTMPAGTPKPKDPKGINIDPSLNEKVPHGDLDDGAKEVRPK